MQYRNQLPQLNDQLFITDGGLETTLVFLEGLDLPELAAIDLVRTSEGRVHLQKYYRGYLDLARRTGLGFVLESPTSRSSSDWAVALGYEQADLDRYNQDAIYMMARLKHEFACSQLPIVVSGCIGPRPNAHQPERLMSTVQAQAYHKHQVELFARAGVDCISAMTMGYVEEAIGIALAARHVEVPSVISFSVETDGRLMTGEPLKEAIELVDSVTGSAPAYYMINCAHPSHFAQALLTGEDWTRRIRGLRANASRCSHAELDQATSLGSGNPDELGRDYRSILDHCPQINVLGGCCGTDIRHLESIVSRVSSWKKSA